MSIEHSNSDDRDDIKVEQDHPQTRKAEPNARGSSEWREDVVPPEGDEEQRAEEGQKPVDDEQEPPRGPVGEMAEDAEAVRRHAVGAKTAGNALGSSAGRDVGSGTEPDRGELGGGEPKAEEGASSPAGTRSPGGEGRE